MTITVEIERLILTDMNMTAGKRAILRQQLTRALERAFQGENAGSPQPQTAAHTALAFNHPMPANPTQLANVIAGKIAGQINGGSNG